MGRNEKVHRLEDLEVEEVSLVDRPANKRPFLVVKRAGSPAVDADGLKLTKSIKETLLSKSADALEVLARVVELVKGAEEGDSVESFDKLKGELQRAADAVKELPGELDKKAEWSTAFINDLPDAAFAIVLPDGKKDDDGKTVPRSLRMLPHHNGDVKDPGEQTTVDLPHLRNALARLDQANMPDSAKETARRHLEAHAKELLETSESAKGVADALSGLISAIGSSSKRAPQDAPNKGGPNAGSGVQPDDKVVGDGNKIPGVQQLVDTMKSLTSEVGSLKQLVAKQDRKPAEPSRIGLPASAGSSTRVEKSDDKESGWPMDMNDPKRGSRF